MNTETSIFSLATMSGPDASERRIRASRAKLIRSHPFFAALLFSAEIIETNVLPTMATDGSNLYFNADFVASLPDDELMGVLVHEILHIVLLHIVRRGQRNRAVWNQACDYAVNALVLASGFTLPAFRLYDAKFENMIAERIYDVLIEAQEQAQQEQPQPQPQGGAEGDAGGAQGGAQPDAGGAEGGAQG